MAHSFVPVERDQALLLPPDLRQWLPGDHLAWLVLDAVEQLDLRGFYRHYRTGAQGRAAYDPKMMVAVLLYAYACGIRSSRDIERRLQEDVAFRVLAANQAVDHATICRFRRAHQAALSDLFVQVMGLCVAAGMIKTTIVAIDGTKIEANAALDRNVNDDQLKKLAAKVFEEAEAIDAEEDRLYGDRRGDEIPEHLLDRQARIEWLRQQLQKREPTTRGSDRNINMTDPESRIMKTPSGYVQGYNAQVAVSEDHVVVAADLTEEAADVNQLEPMIDQTEANLERAGADGAKTIVADAGYLSNHNVSLDVGTELLIAPTRKHRLDEAIDNRVAAPSSTITTRSPPAPSDDRRREVIEAYVARRITASEAASVLLLSIDRVYWLAWQLRKFGWVSSAQVRRSRGPSPRQVMLERLSDPAVRARYERRSQLVEPVLGQLKEPRRLRRFLHRGIDACRSELRLTSAAQNLRKLWSNAQVKAPSPACA